MGIGIGNAQIHSDRAGAGGGTGGAPTDATYIVVSLNATLTAERTLAGEVGVITTSDAGAGGAFTIGIATQGVGTAKIADAAVTYAKIQDVSAAKRLLGRFATTSGDVQEIQIGTNLTLTSDGVLDAAAGSVNFSTGQRLFGRYATTSGAGQEIVVGTNLTLTTDGVLNAAAGSITLSTGQRLLGRFATTSGASQEISVSGGLQLTTDGTLQIATQGVLTSHIADAAVTYAKIQNVSTGQRLLGRFATTSGVVQQITVSQGLTLTTDGELRLAAAAPMTFKGNNATTSAVPVDLTVNQSLRMISSHRRNELNVFTDCIGWRPLASGYDAHFETLPLKGGLTATVIGSWAHPTGGLAILSTQHYGVVIAHSGTTTSCGAIAFTSTMAFIMTGGMRLECMVAPVNLIGTATGEGFFRCGYKELDYLPATNGVYLEFSPSGGVFGVAARGGVRTTTPVIASIAANDWTRGLIEVNATPTTGVTFTVFNDSGTQLGQETATSNIPQTTTQLFGIGLGSVRAASGPLHLWALDYVSAWIDDAVTRGGT